MQSERNYSGSDGRLSIISSARVKLTLPSFFTGYCVEDQLLLTYKIDGDVFSSFQFKHNIVFNDTTMFCGKYKCFEHVGIKKF